MTPNYLPDLLKQNSYPGRGLVAGLTPDGTQSVILYFIMGRSENSRNRVFRFDGQNLTTQAFDESRMTDPSLVIYAPLRQIDAMTVVSNGDQTDTICEFLAQGQSFAEALSTRTFEPDGPHYTPRISGFVTIDGSYALSILKTADGNPSACRRFFYEYATPIAGVGHFLHTYQRDGEILQSFAGEPISVQMENEMEPFAKQVWESLDEHNRISLFVRYMDIRTGAYSVQVYNRHEMEQGGAA